MPDENDHSGGALFKGVLLVHFILFLHLVIIGCLALLVIFLRGVSQYMIWIFLTGMTAVLCSGGLLIWRIRSSGKKALRDINDGPAFKNRPVELSFLGGIASVRFGVPGAAAEIENHQGDRKLQLEGPDKAGIQELTQLAKMYEEDLISFDEYNLAKQQFFNSLSSDSDNSF